MTNFGKVIGAVFALSILLFPSPASASVLEELCKKRSQIKEIKPNKDLAKNMAAHQRYANDSAPDVKSSASNSLKAINKSYGYTHLGLEVICSRVKSLEATLRAKTAELNHSVTKNGADQCTARQMAYSFDGEIAQEIQLARQAIESDAELIKKRLLDARKAAGNYLKPIREGQIGSAGKIDEAKYKKGDEMLKENQDFFGPSDTDAAKAPSYFNIYFEAISKYTAEKKDAEDKLFSQYNKIAAGFATADCPAPPRKLEAEARALSPNINRIPMIKPVDITF